MRDRNTTIIKTVTKQIVFYAVLIAVWQILFYLCVSVFKLWKPYAFPSPAGVWRSLLLLIKQHALFNAVYFSLKRAFIGYVISVIIGSVTGFLLVWIKGFSDTAKPLILGIQTLPSVCWVPFAILWFGLKESAIIFVVIMGSAFSITIAVETAIRNVNPIYIKAAKTMGAKGFNLYFKVILPAGLPSLISGMKQGWSFAWRSLMAGEVMTATIGLGQALTMGRDLADINRVMLIILIIIMLGVLIEKAFFGIAENNILKKMGLA